MDFTQISSGGRGAYRLGISSFEIQSLPAVGDKAPVRPFLHLLSLVAPDGTEDFVFKEGEAGLRPMATICPGQEYFFRGQITNSKGQSPPLFHKLINKKIIMLEKDSKEDERVVVAKNLGYLQCQPIKKAPATVFSPVIQLYQDPGIDALVGQYENGAGKGMIVDVPNRQLLV